MQVLTVVPIQKIDYGKVFPALIRALDMTKDDSKEITFVHDGITAGTTEYIIECVNKIQASMAGRGYDIKLKRVATDFNLYGKSAPTRWALNQLEKGVDHVLILDDGSRQDTSRIVNECKKKGVECLVIKVQC